MSFGERYRSPEVGVSILMPNSAALSERCTSSMPPFLRVRLCLGMGFLLVLGLWTQRDDQIVQFSVSVGFHHISTKMWVMPKTGACSCHRRNSAARCVLEFFVGISNVESTLWVLSAFHVGNEVIPSCSPSSRSGPRPQPHPRRPCGPAIPRPS